MQEGKGEEKSRLERILKRERRRLINLKKDSEIFRVDYFKGYQDCYIHIQRILLACKNYKDSDVVEFIRSYLP